MSETSAAPPGEAPAPLLSSAPGTDPTQGQAEGAPATPADEPASLLADAKAEGETALAAEPEKPAEPAAPAKVEYADLKVPEGIAADSASIKTFADTAQELGVPQAQAEALLAAVAPQIAEQLAAPLKQWNDTQREWQGQIKADKDFGGDRLPQTLATMARLLDNQALTDPGMRDALRVTGMGNNPAFFRSFARYATALTEGSHVGGAPPAAPKRTAAETLYPNHGV